MTTIECICGETFTARPVAGFFSAHASDAPPVTCGGTCPSCGLDQGFDDHRVAHKRSIPLVYIAAALIAIAVLAVSVAAYEFLAPSFLDFSAVGTTRFAQAAAENDPVSAQQSEEFHWQVAIGLARAWSLTNLPNAEVPIVCRAPYKTEGVDCLIYWVGGPEAVTCHGYPPPLNGGGCWRQNGY